MYDEYEIRPLINYKMMWRQEKQDQHYDPNVPITRLLNDGVRTDNIVYDERGQVYCVCSETKEQREMAFRGFAKDRKTLKYRCPAAVYGLGCKGYQECHQQHGGQVSDYGRASNSTRTVASSHLRRVTPPLGNRATISAPRWSVFFLDSTKVAVSSGATYEAVKVFSFP